VLCVLPFEADFYAEHGVSARFVGHPLADSIPLSVDRAAAREALGIRGDAPLVAVLPGSRRAEVMRLASAFLGAAAWLQHERPGTRCAVALASPAMGRAFVEAVGDLRIDPPPFYFTGRTREVMAAADAVQTASGTASLEAMLLKRPMVVAYRVAPLTYRIARRLGVGRVPHFSLPNLLAGRGIVPEFLQEQVRPAVLGPALLDCLDGRLPEPDWRDVFDGVHRQLRRAADRAAAEAVLELLATRGRPLNTHQFSERPLDA